MNLKTSIGKRNEFLKALEDENSSYFSAIFRPPGAIASMLTHLLVKRAMTEMCRFCQSVRGKTQTRKLGLKTKQ